jgi:protease-4
VVLHVDTRGGSALASDVIAREVERLREVKPVVAYFADVAASGGYYVAALAREIVAQPLTVTGSIGVIALRLTAARTLEKVGVTHEVIRRGERADLMSPYRELNEGDRAAFDREIDGFYNDFVGIVARGRGRDAPRWSPSRAGRVYAGVDAHAVGLVDTSAASSSPWSARNPSRVGVFTTSPWSSRRRGTRPIPRRRRGRARPCRR